MYQKDCRKTLFHENARVKKIVGKHKHTKSMRCSKSSSLREVHSDTGLFFKTIKKTQVNHLTYHLKELEKQKVRRIGSRDAS